MAIPREERVRLETLERLLGIRSANLETALSLACDAVAEALGADKVDAFLFQPAKTSLVAMGTSHQPLSILQRDSGLDILPVANGGRVVEVFETNAPYRSGDVQADANELRGIREVLRIASQVGYRSTSAARTAAC